MERPAFLRQTLNPITALRIRYEALETAKQMGIEKGAVHVGGRHRLVSLSGSFGDAAPLYKKLARVKLRDVLVSRRSGSIGKDRRKEHGQKVSDFGGVLKVDIIGGVAITNRKGQFIGGAAFSGGTPEQDEAITRIAIERTGLLTDLPPQPQTQVLFPSHP